MSKNSSPLVLQVGKFYRTRDGRKVGPVTKNECGFKWGPGWDFAADVGHVLRTYHGSGAHSDLDSNSPLDLVAEWTEPAAPGAEDGDEGVVRRFNDLVKAGRVQTAVGRNAASYTSLPVECEYRLKPAEPRTCTLPDSKYEVVELPHGNVKVGCKEFVVASVLCGLRALKAGGDDGNFWVSWTGFVHCRGVSGSLSKNDADALLKFLEEK